jgi:hypothetical protein
MAVLQGGRVLPDREMKMGGPVAENTGVELRYQRGDASADEIQEVVDEVLREFAVPDSDAAREALADGFDLQQLTSARITVREGAQGMEPLLTGMLIEIVASLGSKAAEALWEKILWPRIKRRLGAASLLDKEVASEEGRADQVSP